MNECTKIECRSFETICDDCGRIICSSKFERDDEWKFISRILPDENEACEYKIVVTCRGWYKSEEGKIGFVPDDRQPPICEFTSWKSWENAPSLEEGIIMNHEIKCKMQQEEENV